MTYKLLFETEDERRPCQAALSLFERWPENSSLEGSREVRDVVEAYLMLRIRLATAHAEYRPLSRDDIADLLDDDWTPEEES